MCTQEYSTKHDLGCLGFKEWIDQWNKCCKEVYPSDILESYDSDLACNCLQQFVSKARRADGTQYPPKTLYQMLCALFCHSKVCQPDPPNFLDRKDVHFKKLHSTCDVVVHSFYESGISTRESSTPISYYKRR